MEQEKEKQPAPPMRVVKPKEIQEIMGEIPGVLLRWGAVIIAVVLVLFVGFASYVQVPQTVVVKVKVPSPTAMQWVVASHEAQWEPPEHTGQGQKVAKGQELHIPGTAGQVAQAAGELWWHKPWQAGEGIAIGDTLARLVPLHTPVDLQATGLVPASAYGMVQAGQVVQVQLPFSELALHGHVVQLQAAAEDGGYPVLVNVPYQQNAASFQSLEGTAWQRWSGTASIIISESSILERVLGQMGQEAN